MIGTETRDYQPQTSLARMEDVDVDNLRKRYMEKGKSKLPNDDRSPSEIQAIVDTEETMAFLQFFEMEEDVELDADDPLGGMAQMSAMMDEASQDVLELAESQREMNIEEDAAESIVQVTEFTVNDKDPVLSLDFKENNERIIKKLISDSKKESEPTRSLFDEAREETARQGWSGHRTTEPISSSTSSSNVHQSSREGKGFAGLDVATERMRQFVMNGSYKKPKTKKVSMHQFSGKKKGIKGMFRNAWESTKEWFASDHATTILKVGAMVCLEAAVAVVTKKMEFENGKQVLMYIGMSLGIFVVGTELKEKGFDARRLSI